MVFTFSGQQGTESGNTSRKFTITFIQILTGKKLALDNPFIEGIQLLIRKLAHYTVYAIGGFLIMNYMFTINKKCKYQILYSIYLGGFYAITDEIHQLFVPGRSGRILDVLIDTAGVITGIFIYLGLRKLIKLIKVKMTRE